MNIIHNICISLSFGVAVGFAIGGMKAIFQPKSYSTKHIQSNQKLTHILATILKYITFLLLVLGLIWCIYFLVLGMLFPEQSEYANNMSELIVAVLTVISILFAFVEFLRRKNDSLSKENK